jgi:hypothetical protein
MSTPINPIDGLKPRDPTEAAKTYSEYIEQANSTATSPDIEASEKRSPDATPVAETIFPMVEFSLEGIPDADDLTITSDPSSAMKTVAATLESGNLDPIMDSDKDGVPDYLDATPNGEAISPAEQQLIDTMFSTDTDGDGILDFLDKTGSETQIEQMYDADFARGLEQRMENVRALISLMSMFNNLDLTKYASIPTEHGGDPLTVMVAAGAAQTALMHSAQLQAPLPDSISKRDSMAKLIKNYKQQSDKCKRKNLETLGRLLKGITDAKASPEVVQLKTAILKALPAAIQTKA